MSSKHEGRYAGEFAGRLNVRPLDTIEMMEMVAAGMVGRRLTYAGLTGWAVRYLLSNPYLIQK